MFRAPAKYSIKNTGEIFENCTKTCESGIPDESVNLKFNGADNISADYSKPNNQLSIEIHTSLQLNV